MMPSYFVRTRPHRKAVHWNATTPKLARLLGVPVKVSKKPATEEHDAQKFIHSLGHRVQIVRQKLLLGLTIRLGGMIGAGIAALAVLQLCWVA
jgi:hypothetical protein